MRRTVNVAFNPRPRLPITTPANTWMRSLSPSTTLVWTRTESPTLKFAGSLRNCSDSILSNIAWFINSFFFVLRGLLLLQQIRSSVLGPQFRLLGAPAGDFGMVAGEQHLGD